VRGSRLGTGDLIAAAGGVALFVSLFLPWYGIELAIAGFSSSASVTGWEALELIDVVLLLVALVALGVPAARADGSLGPEFPWPLLVLGAGVLGLFLVLVRLIDVPVSDVSSIAGDRVDVGRKVGPFVALLATAGIAYGGWRANAERGGQAAYTSSA
jgi:hypothetical protein